MLEGDLVLRKLLELELLALEDYLVDVDLALVEADRVDEEVLLAQVLPNLLVLEGLASSKGSRLQVISLSCFAKINFWLNPFRE